MHIKNAEKYHYTNINQKANITKTDNTKCQQECGVTELSNTADSNANWYSHFGKQFGSVIW